MPNEERKQERFKFEDVIDPSTGEITDDDFARAVEEAAEQVVAEKGFGEDYKRNTAIRALLEQRATESGMDEAEAKNEVGRYVETMKGVNRG